MNSIKILMALVAMCVLTVPAFSMPDRGTGQETCKCKQICDCPKPMEGDPCDCLKPMMSPEAGPIKVKVVKSMMGDRCKDGEQSPADFPMAEMGHEAGPIKAKIVKSMMGQDDKPMLKAHVKSMMGDRCQDDDRNPCNCPRPMMEDKC